MKHLLLQFLGVMAVSAQFPVAPGTGGLPPSSDRRNFDKAQEVQPSIAPTNTKDEKITRYISQLSLTEIRQWTSTEGKVIEAKLIAFEDLVVESREGVEPQPPEPPKHPTVVRDGMVRLAVNRKPMVLPLSRLINSDQKFIEKIRVQHAPKP